MPVRFAPITDAAWIRNVSPVDRSNSPPRSRVLTWQEYFPSGAAEKTRLILSSKRSKPTTTSPDATEDACAFDGVVWVARTPDLTKTMSFFGTTRDFKANMEGENSPREWLERAPAQRTLSKWSSKALPNELFKRTSLLKSQLRRRHVDIAEMGRKTGLDQLGGTKVAACSAFVWM